MPLIVIVSDRLSLKSIAHADPKAKVRLLFIDNLLVPPEPGEIVAPELTVTAPPIFPEPLRVPALTVTGPVPVAEPALLATLRTPPEIIVPPLYLFCPESVSVPLPILVIATVPSESFIRPLNVEAALLLPIVNVAAPAAELELSMVPAPVKLLIVSLNE